MKVAITGSTGHIGTHLVHVLRAAGHEVVPLVRRAPRAGEIRWQPGAVLDPAALAGVDAVVHLAGVGIADHRWSEQHKQAVLRSRIEGTTTIAAAVAAGDPTALVSGSAIGWYGDTGSRAVDESAPSGAGFLADVCRQWEACTAPAAEAGVRVATVRTGLVCGRGGGLMGRMLPLFKLGLGGKLGSGRQYWSWISMADEVGAIRHVLEGDLAGPVNLTGPDPVTNAEFTKALAQVLGRPAVTPVPPFALRIVLGGFADEGVLSGQRVLPHALTESGYTFEHPTVEAALRYATAR
jgi:uncharacterized protein